MERERGGGGRNEEEKGNIREKEFLENGHGRNVETSVIRDDPV